MHCVILRSDSVQFGILSEFLSRFRPNLAFCFYCFLQLLTKYSRENHLPYHFLTKRIWFIMTRDKWYFGSFRNLFQIRNFRLCQLWPAFFSDRLGGQVSGHKDTGTLDKIKMKKKKKWRNCWYGILYCCWWYTKLIMVEIFTTQPKHLKVLK